MTTRTNRFVPMFMAAIMLIMMFTATASAADVTSASMERADYYNPVFYSESVSAYNTSTGSREEFASASWSWGNGFPTMLHVAREDYRAGSTKYDGWLIEYTGNTKSCTYLRIYDESGNTYYSSQTAQDQPFTIRFVVRRYSSLKKFYCDRTVAGYTVTRVEIGGFDVV